MSKLAAFARVADETRTPYRTELRRVELSASAKGVGAYGRVGESNPMARHPDELVARARAMSADGTGSRAISAALGVPNRTVRTWVNGTRRQPMVCKTVLVRRKVPIDA